MNNLVIKYFSTAFRRLVGICTLASKIDVISSVRKRYCALGLGLGLELRLGLAEIHFRSNVFSSKYSRYRLVRFTLRGITPKQAL